MAELHVQQKRNTNWWVWLVLSVMIIAGAAYYYTHYYQRDNHSGYGKSATGDSTNHNQQDTIANPLRDSGR